MRWLALVASPALMAFTVARDPAVLQPVRWPDAEITFVLQQDGSDNVSDGSDIQAILWAMRAWSPPCTTFAFVDGGRSQSRADALDGTNRIAFVENDWPAPLGLAVAYTNRYRDTSVSPSVWLEADILLNGTDMNLGPSYEIEWSTTGLRRAYDIQGVVAHELGHAMGLNHSAHPESTMYFRAAQGTLYGSTPSPDDVHAVCYLYPAQSTPCASDAECPLLSGSEGGADVRHACVGTSCQVGQVGFGTDCTADAQCESGICLPDPETGGAAYDPGFCSQPCTVGGAPCPGGALCANDPQIDPGGGRCLLGRDDCWDIYRDDNVPPCEGLNNYCIRDTDGQNRCRFLCLTDFNCQGVPLGVCDGVESPSPGFCREAGEGVGAAPCDSPYDCNSLRCLPDFHGQGRCMPFDPNDPNVQDPPPGAVGDGGGGDFIVVPTINRVRKKGCAATDVAWGGVFGAAWLLSRSLRVRRRR